MGDDLCTKTLVANTMCASVSVVLFRSHSSPVRSRSTFNIIKLTYSDFIQFFFFRSLPFSMCECSLVCLSCLYVARICLYVYISYLAKSCCCLTMHKLPMDFDAIYTHYWDLVNLMRTRFKFFRFCLFIYRFVSFCSSFFLYSY